MILLMDGKQEAKLNDLGWTSTDPGFVQFLNYVACPLSVTPWTPEAIRFLAERAARKLGPGWTVARL